MFYLKLKWRKIYKFSDNPALMWALLKLILNGVYAYLLFIMRLVYELPKLCELHDDYFIIIYDDADFGFKVLNISQTDQAICSQKKIFLVFGC